MGQRLNFEVCYDGKVLANAYYHRSAYTSSALGILGEVIKAYNNRTEINPLRVAVEILQATGAGVNESERELIAKETDGKFSGIEFNDAIDRNKGLLSVTEKGINDTRYWEEGRVTFDIGTEEFVFDLMWEMSVEDYEDGREPGDALKLKTIESVDFEFKEPWSYRDYEKFAKLFHDNPDGFRIDDDTILCWIE